MAANVWCWGPLEIHRSRSGKTWRASWHRPRDAKHGVWMYRWSVVTPWIWVGWIAAEFRRMCAARPDETEGPTR